MSKRKDLELPGIMVYFDDWDALGAISYEERGMVITCMLDYGFSGEEPDVPGELAAVWPFMRKSVERSISAYRKKVRQRKYARACVGKAEGDKPSYEDWQAAEQEVEPEVTKTFTRWSKVNYTDFNPPKCAM